MRFTLAAALVALCSGIAAQENDWEIYLYPDGNCESSEYVFMSGIDNWTRCTTWKDPNMGTGPDVTCTRYTGDGDETEKCGNGAFPVANSYRIVKGEVDMYERYSLPLKMCDRFKEIKTYQGDTGCVNDWPAEGLLGRPHP